MTRLTAAIFRAATACLALAALIVLAIVAGAVPVPGSASVPSGDGPPVTIHVLSNGFHTDLVLPASAVETRLPVRRTDYPVNQEAVRHYAIGWGSRTAYTSLRAVSDLTPGIVARAFLLDETVVHVAPLGDLAHDPDNGVYEVTVSRDQLDAMLDDIGAFFAAPAPIPALTQGFGDRFYEAEGRFSPVVSCNSWTGRRLRNAGIGVGLWTITAQSLEFSLSRLPRADPPQAALGQMP